jgi:hypothetical protein
MSRASWGVAGSNIGMYDMRLKWRLSCSFWDELRPGSSPSTITMPPMSSSSGSWTIESEATLSPTDLKKTHERWPLSAAPVATSRATFSLADHSK